MIIGLNCELSCGKDIETGANAKDRKIYRKQDSHIMNSNMR